MKYTKKFETDAEYDNFLLSENYITPHVIVIKNATNIKYRLKDLVLDCTEYPCDVNALDKKQYAQINDILKKILTDYLIMAENDIFENDISELPTIEERHGRSLIIHFKDIEFKAKVLCFNKQVILAPEDKMRNIAHIYYIEANSDEVYIDYSCIVYDTDIKLSNGKTKKIQDISYDDYLLVWDFDKGNYTSAKPLWIKKAETAIEYYLCEFENGSSLKLVGSNGKCHRVFNYTDGVFESATDCIGKEIYTTQGITRLMNVTKVQENVKYYNIITEYHMNLFANGILTSCRYNNIYPIENMKFIGVVENKHEDIPNIPSEYVNGMRLKEQTFTIDEMTAYINNLNKLKKD